MKYLILDSSTLESSKVLCVAQDAERANLLAKIATAGNDSVSVFPLEGRSFSKLEKLQLQYVFWNNFQIAPPEDYAELLRECLARFSEYPVDSVPVSALLVAVRKLYPNEETNPIPKGKPSEVTPTRPRAVSTTGRVWELADVCFAKVGNVFTPELRKNVIAACTVDGINESTSSTQYSRWKKAKEQSI
jgi:hypothetical protein